MKLDTRSTFKQLSKYNKNLLVLTNEQVRQVQQINLETLHDIVEVCDRLDVNYHLTGGSALGVVRHKGFIPWDDDIDIDMARKDIGRFFNAFQEDYGEKYWIHSLHSEGSRCIQCYYIRRKGTTFQRDNDATSYQAGVCVDVLVMENTFDNTILRKVHGFFSMVLGFIVSCRRFYLTRNYLLKISDQADEIQKVFKKKIAIGRLFSFLPLETWVRLFDKWNSICHNEQSRYVVVPTGRNHFFRETYLRADFAETTMGQFEDLQVKIPKNWDGYLRHMFGDYMEIPEEGNREQHALIKLQV